LRNRDMTISFIMTHMWVIRIAYWINLSSPLVFSGVRVTRFLALCVWFAGRCLSFCTFSFGHCVVCS
jgi:hypothetical protein